MFKQGWTVEIYSRDWNGRLVERALNVDYPLFWTRWGADRYARRASILALLNRSRYALQAVRVSESDRETVGGYASGDARVSDLNPPPESVIKSSEPSWISRLFNRH